MREDFPVSDNDLIDADDRAMMSWEMA